MPQKNQRADQQRVELADVFRLHAESYCKENQLTSEQYKVIHAIQNCRTSALGGHVQACDHCGYEQISYNSCRNRHCPKCESLRTKQWLDKRRAELLPVDYFHMVFTLPHELNHLIMYNKKQLYGLLFESAWETVKTLGNDPKRLAGLMGMLAILHTWGQNISQHNHLHCIVPGGALTDQGRWKPSKKGYLFPVKVVSTMFRGVYISKLRALYKNQGLKLPNTDNIDSLLDQLMKKEWIIYTKKPFAGPQKLLDYLGRYTHKIAISNHRILSCDQHSVTFRWRDYADKNKVKVMKLTPHEFIRRFLSHVVPHGFMRIRCFGFLANACKAKNIQILQEKLAYATLESNIEKDTRTLMIEVTGKDIVVCPACKKGSLHMTRPFLSKFGRTMFDTS